MDDAFAAHMAKVSGAATQPSPLPSAPMLWGRPDEANDAIAESTGFDQHFAGVALNDDDFDAPVYRSLAGVLDLDAMGSLDLASENEDSPRYRSLEMVSHPSSPHDEPMSAEAAERAWLETNPPLIRRQNALRPSIVAVP